MNTTDEQMIVCSLTRHEPVDLFHNPVTINLNNFKYKSLSSAAVNFAIGCGPGCSFCSVPLTTTRKLKKVLADYGVMDPDAEFGNYGACSRVRDEFSRLARFHWRSARLAAPPNRGMPINDSANNETNKLGEKKTEDQKIETSYRGL